MFLQDKLPSPNSSLKLTLLVPSNKAFLSLMWHNGLFLPIISKIGTALPATVLYNVIPLPISPAQMGNASEAAPGSTPSAYGLLAGTPADLSYFQTDGVSHFKAGLNDGMAEADGEPINVCGNYIYITDEVLVPAASEKLSDVQGVNIPDNLLGGGGGNSSSSPDASAPSAAPTPADAATCVIPPQPTGPMPTAPVVKPVPAPTPLAPTPAPVPAPVPVTTPLPVNGCNTTFVEAAKANGLNILATALNLPQIADSLPNPGTPNTLLAPGDAAFFNVLSTLNISLNDAMALGDRLAGVLLYHVHPGEAFSLEDLRSRDNFTTALGERLGDEATYVISVDASSPSATVLRAIKPGNLASVGRELQVCATKVFVIDQVLLPAENLDSLPDPGSAPSTNGIAAAVRAVEGWQEQPSLGVVLTPDERTPGKVDSGLAAGVGALANCSVRLEFNGSNWNTTTNGRGMFSFGGFPDCAIPQATLVLPAGLEQLASCVDKATGLPPPYALRSQLSSLLGNASEPSNPGGLPINLTPLTNLISSPLFGSGQGLPDLTGILGFVDLSAALFGDFIDGLTGGSSDALASITSNAQALISGIVGGSALSELVPGASMDSAASAINSILASNPTNFVNLTDPASVTGLLKSALGLLQGLNPDSAGSGRKLLQGGVDTDAVLAAVATPMALLNQMARDGAKPGSESQTVYDPQEVSNLVARCTRVAQDQVAPAAGQLAAGSISVQDFNDSYAPQKVISAVAANEAPALVQPAITPDAPAAEPEPGNAPAASAALRAALPAVAAVLPTLLLAL